MPCHAARARELLSKGKAAVYRRYPFIIILKARTGGETQPIQIKLDPGSVTTGITVVMQAVRSECHPGEFLHTGKPASRTRVQKG
ncbi:RRXRR domain-containing protein [Deinococcus radiomollis]|uniref:RRXRR domain-containing protein n=1 Tax=Deinococcus radiomollis TaxID=468916 RepID=UPI003892CB09